jgi:uncharacterized membrane-anchored protein YitT (DUF2179 family)
MAGKLFKSDKALKELVESFKKMKVKLTKERVRALFLNLFLVAIGCAISAFATIGILIPNGLSSGGLTGVVRILQSFIPLDFSIMYYCGAMVVFVVCWILLGLREARKILVVTILYPSFLVLFEGLHVGLLQEKDIILAAIYVGVISGIGAGIIFQRGFSFGGTDTIAKIIRKKALPFVSLSQILLVIDGVVIITSGFVFGRNIALYALVTQVIFAKTVEVVMFGFDSKLVQVEIITNKHDQIAQYILEEIGRGVSNIEITGVYTGERRIKILTICSPRESMLIKTYIAKEDRKAFVSVIHVESVWGTGTGFGSLTDKE